MGGIQEWFSPSSRQDWAKSQSFPPVFKVCSGSLGDHPQQGLKAPEDGCKVEERGKTSCKQEICFCNVVRKKLNDYS